MFGVDGLIRYTNDLYFDRDHPNRERLVSGSDPIIQIALECGLGNLSNFNRVFRKHIGMSPREYRSAYSGRS